MDKKVYSISLEKNPLISMKVIPGHFTTSHSHISHFIDLNVMKSNALIARDIARELATPYMVSTTVDTIVCMEKTEVVGAYLAEEIYQEGMPPFNNSGEIHVVTPINNANGNLLCFQGSAIELIAGKNTVLLVASMSSGQTVKKALDCIAFYGGKVVGISALFLASPEKQEREIHALFTSEDIPDYKIMNINECDMCKSGKKLDAIVSSEGYTEI